VNEQRLADPRGTDHGEQRPRVQQRQRGANLVGTAEEVLRIVFDERCQSAIRADLTSRAIGGREHECLEVMQQLGRALVAVRGEDQAALPGQRGENLIGRGVLGEAAFHIEGADEHARPVGMGDRSAAGIAIEGNQDGRSGHQQQGRHLHGAHGQKCALSAGKSKAAGARAAAGGSRGQAGGASILC